MNANVKEWISKAEGDYATAARELRATDLPNYDAVCFHADPRLSTPIPQAPHSITIQI